MNDYTYTNDTTTQTPSLEEVVATYERLSQQRRDAVLALLAAGNKLAESLLLIAEKPGRYCLCVRTDADLDATREAIRWVMQGMDFPDRSAEVQIQVSAAVEAGKVYILDKNAWLGFMPAMDTPVEWLPEKSVPAGRLCLTTRRERT